MQQHKDWPGVVEDVRRALAPKGRLRLQQFAIEGLRLVERAMRAGRPPRRLVISERALRQPDVRTSVLLGELARVACEVFPVPEGVVLELAEGRPAGLMFGLCDLPVEPDLSVLLARSASGAGPVLVLVDVEEPGNVGALVRTALAAGSAGLVAAGVSDPYHPKAVRTSMGSLFKLPVLRVRELPALLVQLAGARLVAGVAEAGRAPWESNLVGVHAVLLGRESEGLPLQLRERADQLVTIPMPSGVDSFSVNAAAAVLLYEALRQRTPRLGALGAPQT